MNRNQAEDAQLASMAKTLLAQGTYVESGVAAIQAAFDDALIGRAVQMPWLMRMCVLAGMEYATTTQMTLAVHGCDPDTFSQLAEQMSAVQRELQLLLLPTQGTT